MQNEDKLRKILLDCISNAIDRISEEDTQRPFHSALLPSDALFWSRFERSFSTSFGSQIEHITKIAAESNGAVAECQRVTEVVLDDAVFSAIDNHTTTLRNNKNNTPCDWNNAIKTITAVNKSGTTRSERVISDIWWNLGGVDNYMSIKTVKPNIDQTEKAKRDLLRLKMCNPACNVYFGLYYNPYGSDKANYKWSIPARMFDVANDDVVLIGKGYWDTIGGLGYYEDILKLAEDVGRTTIPIIEAIR